MGLPDKKKPGLLLCSFFTQRSFQKKTLKALWLWPPGIFLFQQTTSTPKKVFFPTKNTSTPQKDLLSDQQLTVHNPPKRGSVQPKHLKTPKTSFFPHQIIPQKYFFDFFVLVFVFFDRQLPKASRHILACGWFGIASLGTHERSWLAVAESLAKRALVLECFFFGFYFFLEGFFLWWSDVFVNFFWYELYGGSLWVSSFCFWVSGFFLLFLGRSMVVFDLFE